MDNAFRLEPQRTGGQPDAVSGGPGVSFMPKLGSRGPSLAVRLRFALAVTRFTRELMDLDAEIVFVLGPAANG